MADLSLDLRRRIADAYLGGRTSTYEEKAWAKMKELMRRLNTLTREAFDAAVAAAIISISIDDITAWFGHAGYQV